MGGEGKVWVGGGVDEFLRVGRWVCVELWGRVYRGKDLMRAKRN